MAITTHERFGGYPCSFDSNLVNHIRSVRAKFGPSKMSVIPSGAVDVAVPAEAFGEHGADIVTGDLAAVLAFCAPTSGYLLSGVGALLQFQQRALGGTFMGANSHVTLTAPAGFLYVEELSGTQDAKEGASMKLGFYPLPSGSTPPISVLAGQSLTGSVAVNGLYKLGPVVYEGSKVLGVQSVNFKTGIKVDAKRSSGGLYADTLSIVERRPTLSIRGTNLSWPTAIGPDMSAVSAGISVYFACVTATGAFNIKITFAGGVYSADGAGASGTGDAESNVMVDMAGGLITYSTTATLP